MTVTAFVFYRRLQSKHLETQSTLLNMLVWTLAAFFHLFVIILMGQKTTNETKVTSMLVHKRMRASPNAEVVSKVLFDLSAIGIFHF